MIHYKQLFLYFYQKLIGSGFAFTIFVVFIYIFIENNLFNLSEILSSPWIWAAFYGYATFCSIMIDAIEKYWPKVRRWILLLYIFAGYIVFAFIMFEWMYLFIAGTVGAIAAVLYFIGIRKIVEYRWIGTMFALIPLIFIWIAVTDFTQKEDWAEQRDATSFTATFSYFDGEHRIPIQLKKGDSLSFQVEFDTSGGYGFHFENEKGAYLSLEEKGNRMGFHATDDGIYEIVIHGSEATGGLTVNWDINQY